MLTGSLFGATAAGMANRRRWFPLGALLLSLTVLFTAVVEFDGRRQLASIRDSMAAAQIATVSLASAPGVDTAPADFALALPAAPPLDAFLRDLQAASELARVSLASVTTAPRPATVQSLGRVELSITLRGDYAGIKSTIANTLGQYPQAVLRHLSLRRQSAPADLESRVDLVLLTRPGLDAGAIR